MFLRQLLGDRKNPADSAMPYLDQIPEQLRPYFEPYINAGKGAIPGLQEKYGRLSGNLPSLQEQYGQLMNDPGSFYNKLGAGYKESPGFKFSRDQAMNSAQQAMAAGGMSGSPQHAQYAADISEQMANRDFNDYLKQVLGMYGMGLGGEQGLFNKGLSGEELLAKMGLTAGTEYGTDIGNALSSKADLSYSGQASQNKADSDFWNNLMKMAGQAGMAYMTGGIA